MIDASLCVYSIVWVACGLPSPWRPPRSGILSVSQTYQDPVRRSSPSVTLLCATCVTQPCVTVAQSGASVREFAPKKPFFLFAYPRPYSAAKKREKGRPTHRHSDAPAVNMQQEVTPSLLRNVQLGRCASVSLLVLAFFLYFSIKQTYASQLCTLAALYDLYTALAVFGAQVPTPPTSSFPPALIILVCCSHGINQSEMRWSASGSNMRKTASVMCV